MFVKKTLVDKLVEECSSVIEENKLYNETLGVTSLNYCASCTVYIVLFVFLLLCLIFDSVSVYFYWYKKSNPKENSVRIRFNPHSLINY